MAKKKGKSLQPTNITPAGQVPVRQAPSLTPEMEKKLKNLKKKLDSLKDKVLDKFGDYILGITLLPPEKKPAADTADKSAKSAAPSKASKESKEDPIHVLVVVDDTTSTKMTKDELHQKFSTIISKMAEDVDKNLKVQSVLLTDIWQHCYDGKSELNKMISMGAPVYDSGLLGAIKITEIHKSMVIKKFEKYILSYVLMGSITRGKAVPESDIDVWIVIDDTDVKKMTRAELKDKLRAIIAGMAIEAGEITGIKNKLSCQVHILTDVWDSLKEANPIVFTFLRDGVPFYDRGIFMPWKQLLRMGRIKPSKEAIDLFMSTGEQSIKRIKGKLKDMAMEDLFYSILTPSQAALMLYGLPPPIPRETPDVMDEIFVKKEKMLKPEYVKILRDMVKLHKDIEYSRVKDVSGTLLDKYLTSAEKYLVRIRKLFEEIEQKQNEKSIVVLYDEVITIIRDVLKMEGVTKSADKDMVRLFEEELISASKVPARYLRDLNEIVEAKKKFDTKKLTKTDIDAARKGSAGLVRFLIEYMQRKRGQELERARIRVKHGNKFGEVLLFEDKAFVIFDIDAREQRIEVGELHEDGSLGPLKESRLEDLEKEMAKNKFHKNVFIKEPIFEDLKKLFGSDVQVLMHR